MAFYGAPQREVIEAFFPQRADDYHLLLEKVGELIERRVLPSSDTIDRDGAFPSENLKLLFENGVCSMSFPEDYGGLGLPYPLYIAAIEMTAMACASTALSLDIHSTVCEGINMHGTSTQKMEYLEPLIHGRKLAAFALTEPQSGSDAGNIRTIADPKEEGFSIKGSKMFITNGGVADIYLVFASTLKGPTAFLVDADSQGLSVGPDLDKIGVRGSRTTEITFNDVYVPKTRVLGREGEGFEYAKAMLATGRITIAATSMGIAQMALDRTMRYVASRYAFDQPLSEFQITQEKIASMIIELSAARWMTYRAALLKDRGRNYTSEAAQAKVISSEVALRVCDHAIQLHGGYGYAGEGSIHRHWRDARLMTIGEGTSEILRLLIGRMALKGDFSVSGAP